MKQLKKLNNFGMSNRHQARILTLQILSNLDFNHSFFNKDPNLEEVTQSVLKNFAPLNFDEQDFVLNLVKGTTEKISEIDEQIKKFAPTWPIEKIAIIDKNILRLGIFELLFLAETPPKVIINEAIEIAKAFGSSNSPKFINGVLGAIYEEVKKTKAQS
ncbi:transcription antitermination factor NusB [Candidatus Kuenenbacteria bacterium]|nr:transcription antitermination factor NusB [Candidatus Kuenenbacteria bacterium]